MLIESLAVAYLPFFFGRAVDTCSNGCSIKNSISFFSLMLSIVAVRFAASFLNSFILGVESTCIVNDIRKKLFKHIMHLKLNFFSKNPSGKIATRVCYDTSVMGEIYFSVLSYFIKDLAIIILVFIFMIKVSLYLFFATVSILSITAVFSKIIGDKLRDESRGVRKELAKMNSFLREATVKSPYFRVCGFWKNMKNRFEVINEKLFKAHIRYLNAFAVFRPIADLSSTTTVGLSLLTSSLLYSYGLVSLGQIISFMSWIKTLFTPIVEFSEKYSIVQTSFSALENIKEVFSEKEEEKNGHRISSAKNVAFDDVSFSYDGINKVLESFNSSFNNGELVLIKGKSGIGKTTMANLIVKFIDPNHGSILLDKRDIHTANPELVRKRVKYIVQEVIDEDGISCPILNMLDELIEKKDFDTLIVDEAASSLPPPKEVELAEKISKLKGQKTVIVIAHRSKIWERFADRTITLK